MRLALGIFLISMTIVVFGIAIWASRRPGAGEWIFGWGSDAFTLTGLCTLTFGISNTIYYVVTISQWPSVSEFVMITVSMVVSGLAIRLTFIALARQRAQKTGSEPATLPLVRPHPHRPLTEPHRQRVA